MNVNIISLRAINLSHFCQLIPLIAMSDMVLYCSWIYPPMHLVFSSANNNMYINIRISIKKNDGFLKMMNFFSYKENYLLFYLAKNLNDNSYNNEIQIDKIFN